MPKKVHVIANLGYLLRSRIKPKNPWIKMKKLHLLFALSVSLSFSLSAFAKTSEGEWAQRQYERSESSELKLTRKVDGNPLLGVSVFQRSRADGSFCRKFVAVYPGAKPTFSCFNAIIEGQEAEEIYNAADVAEASVLFSADGQVLVGAQHFEKTTLESEDSAPLLCVKTGAVVPNPEYSYRCFIKELPIGSGVSVGN